MTRVLPRGESSRCIEERSLSLTEAPINCEDREGSRLLSSVPCQDDAPLCGVLTDARVAAATGINSFHGVSARTRLVKEALSMLFFRRDNAIRAVRSLCSHVDRPLSRLVLHE